MKRTPRSASLLISTAAAIVVCTTGLHAGTVSTTFSFQQGDLRQDGSPYGSGASYTGVLDGRILDNSATSALNTADPAMIGNQFQSGSNGRTFIRLFSYDLTELSDFITANTSAFSSVELTSVSFKIVAAGSTLGTVNGEISLFRTDPFTSGATWSTTDGSTTWTNPYQNISNETQYNYTGGGSALTANLGGSSPSTGGQTAGNPMQWTSSADFIDALNHALGQVDKTLYLMAARPLGNYDGRVSNYNSNTTTVDDRPELVITLDVTTTAAPATWTGATSNSWITAGNWSPASVPATDAPIIFDSSSTANLNTVLNQDFTVTGVTVTSPTGAVSIGGANSLTLGAGGLDLSAAAQNLTITAPIVTSVAQSWNINTGRTLGISGAVTGSGDITVAGTGKVSLGASNILPNGASAGNLALDGTLDLNGTSQSVNAMTGSGIVDNTAVGSATLTIGNNDATGTFSGTLQDTGGALAVVKTGNGNLGLTGANDFSGGFTNNGSGNVAPNNDLAFGTGPVVSNAGQLYATATTIFANTLALNDTTLRIGGANNRTITWNGPVTATGTSGLSADSGTAGITLGSTLNIAGATFNSFANGTTHNIDGNVSGAGGNLNVTGGTLQLSGTGSYTGTTTLSGSGVLRLQPTGTISSSSNVVINGSGNFNVRNTVGWVYTGTITGDGTGVINLNTLTDAELAGPISGVPAITANNSGTNTTVSGAISGAVNVTATGGAILTLSGDNSGMGGGVTINGATAGTQLNLGSATALGTGDLTISGGTGKIDNTSGSALTLSTNNTQAWNQNISFVGTDALNLGTGAVTMGGNRTLNVTNTLTVGGNIGDGGSGYGIIKNGWGNLVLTGTSTYSGATVIAQSTLSVGSIKDYGVASAIGAPLSGDIQLGNANDFCNLIYTGSGDSTNRTVQLGNTNPANTGVGSIKNNGTGALTFTATNFNPPIPGITAGRLLWLGGTYTGGNNEIQGIIQDNDTSGAVGVGKGNDDSIWVLSGANTYTGTTIVQGGTLKLGASGSIASSSSVSVNSGGTLDTSAQATYTIPGGQPVVFGIDAAGSGSSGKIAAAGLNVSSAVVTYNIAGTPDDPVYVLATYTGLTGTFASVDAPPAGYTLNYAYEGNKIALVAGAASGYAAWASLNGAGPNLNDDHDGDGVDNGTEFFIGGTSGNTTGFTPLPGVINTAGTLSVTWPKGAGYTGTYPADFVVETSTTLSGAWVAETVGVNVTNSSTEVKYTFPLPLSGKNFVRLKVTGP